VLLIGALGLASCADPVTEHPAQQAYSNGGFSTYVKYLSLARDGDPRYQNLIGFMSFFGEVAPLDRQQAHLWFHLAADQGYAPAKRNLAVMHGLGFGAVEDGRQTGPSDAGNGALVETAPRMATVRRDRPERPVERTYATFCAGCHGLNGIAAYIGSPSFALGERLDKTDAALLGSIRDGMGIMPSWDNKLPDPMLEELLDFVRDFERQYEAGIGQSLRHAPDLFFLFGPMIENDAAYRGVPAE